MKTPEEIQAYIDEHGMAATVDYIINDYNKLLEQFEPLLQKANEIKTHDQIIDALVTAYVNADKQPLTSEDLRFGHRAGVRDVAVRLGLYDKFIEREDR